MSWRGQEAEADDLRVPRPLRPHQERPRTRVHSGPAGPLAPISALPPHLPSLRPRYATLPLNPLPPSPPLLPGMPPLKRPGQSQSSEAPQTDTATRHRCRPRRAAKEPPARTESSAAETTTAIPTASCPHSRQSVPRARCAPSLAPRPRTCRSAPAPTRSLPGLEAALLSRSATLSECPRVTVSCCPK